MKPVVESGEGRRARNDWCDPRPTARAPLLACASASVILPDLEEAAGLRQAEDEFGTGLGSVLAAR